MARSLNSSSRWTEDVLKEIGHGLRRQALLKAIGHERPWLGLDGLDVNSGQYGFIVTLVNQSYGFRILAIQQSEVQVSIFGFDEIGKIFRLQSDAGLDNCGEEFFFAQGSEISEIGA